MLQSRNESDTTHPCYNSDTIERIQGDMVLLQHDVRDAFSEVKESVRLFQVGQDKITDVLIDVAKTQERLLSVADKTDQNRQDIDNLGRCIRKSIYEVRETVHDVENHVSALSVQQSYFKSPNGKFDKTQITVITGAVTGFLTFIYTLVNKLIDFVLSGGSTL